METNQASAAPPVDPKAKRQQLLSALKILPALVKAIAWNQNKDVVQRIEEIAAILDNHAPAQAQELRRAASRLPKQMAQTQILPAHLLTPIEPQAGFEAVVLPADVLIECQKLVDEHEQAQKLAAFGLDPRHLLLLHGPPGNGKTMLAQALAFELGLPCLQVKYGGLLGSYLGETGKNIDAVLSYASSMPCVVFADEFDGIGGVRGDASGGSEGEMRRATNQLLIALEQLPPTCVFVAATNTIDHLDRAILRRFDLTAHLGHPSHELRLRCATMQLSQQLTPGHNLQHLAARIAERGGEQVSLHAIVQLCRRLRRDLALHGGEGIEPILLAWEGTAGPLAS